jgi:hypothetical protein
MRVAAAAELGRPDVRVDYPADSAPRLVAVSDSTADAGLSRRPSQRSSLNSGLNQSQNLSLSLNQSQSLSLSLSHCCETAAVAVADRPVIGCDILSRARAVHWQRIAASFFNEADYEWIMAAPGEARERFGSVWCINEAIAKCSGLPLLRVLRGSEASREPQPLPGSAALRESTGDRGKNGYWAQSGTVADCFFAVASDVPLAIHVREVPIETL